MDFLEYDDYGGLGLRVSEWWALGFPVLHVLAHRASQGGKLRTALDEADLGGKDVRKTARSMAAVLATWQMSFYSCHD